jgi:3-oxoacyl-[acyl-carrier-protein] synthase-3
MNAPNQHCCGSQIASTGSYLPALIVKNSDLHQFPPTAVPLIEQKTGVRQRRHAAINEFTSDLAFMAAKACLTKVNFPVDQIDGIILATSSPDRSIPATATRVQSILGLKNAFAFDLNAVCSGAVHAIHVADALISSGRHQNILVIAAELYSRILNPKDFSTYPYFGDGAGAVLLTPAYNSDGSCILATRLHTDGAGADLVQVPASGTMLHPSKAKCEKELFFTMNGREVFEFAVNRGTEIILETLEAAKISKLDVAHVVVHQANINIVKQIAAKTQIPFERFYTNLADIGNTAAASVLIALDELIASNKTKNGDIVAVAAFGAGLSWGCNVIRL